MKNREKDLQVTLKNLQKLVDELPKEAIEDPRIIEDFTMEKYGLLDDEPMDIPIHKCDTHGCLLGNSVRVLDVSEKDYIISFDSEELTFSYNSYGERVFPYLYYVDNEPGAAGNLWDFLFHGDWLDIDNTFEGALARVKYLIKNHDNEQLKSFDFDDFREAERFSEGWHIGTEYETKLD